ncbi:MAG TPA: glycosyltransferase family 87 protein [Anaerolineales bacterium]
MNTARQSTSNLLFICLLVLLIFFVGSSLWSLSSATDFGESDFKIYWSATYLLSRGENPYSLELIETVHRTQLHSTSDVRIIAWNPPFLFVFLLPLAWLSYPLAKFVWVMANLAILATAGIMLANLYLHTASMRLKLAFLILVMGFPAAITGLYMGQVTFLVFWGLVTCMALIKKEQWFWAGAALILTTIKPHMVILSVLYLLVIMARRHKYSGWAGLAVAGLACLTILLLFRADVLYNLVGETSVASGRWATSTVGGLLSHLGITEAARYLILLFLPLPFLLARFREQLSMEFSVALLTLITVPITVFGWSYDQTILLIPIAQIFSWLTHAKSRLAIIGCMAGAIALNYLQRTLPLNEAYYVWIPLFWWFIFGFAWRSTSTLKTHHAEQPV